MKNLAPAISPPKGIGDRSSQNRAVLDWVHEVELLTKPDVLAYDAVRVAEGVSVYGTGLAAPFAAGIAAVRMQASPSRHEFLHALRQQIGSIRVDQSGRHGIGQSLEHQAHFFGVGPDLARLHP